MRLRGVTILSFGLLAALFVNSGLAQTMEPEIRHKPIDNPKVIGSIETLPQVLLVTTGGTIAEKVDAKSKAAVPAISGDDLIKAIPDLVSKANLKVVNFSNIDSSQMTPARWAELSRKVDALLKTPKYQGAVITHGTDTMAEAAFFLELTLKTEKPVVFVGAMRTASDVSADGPDNLLDAVTQVTSPEARKWGVTVTMNQYVNAAKHVVKTQTTSVDAFKSGEYGYLGYIIEGKVVHFNDKPAMKKLAIPEKLPDVVLLTTYAGDNGRFVRMAVDSGAKGIVVEGLGAGNVNDAVFKQIKYALSKKVVVVVTSRVVNGGVYPLYGDDGGGEALEKAGAILGGQLRGPKARLLLMLALGQKGVTAEAVKGYFK